MTYPCPFCHPDPDRIVDQGPLFLILRDAFPVADGHTLILPRRHIGSFFETTFHEREALMEALLMARESLEATLAPAGYNIGINDGEAAGQTVGHLHIHLIPRFAGDSPDPRGGVRWIFPDKAKYWDD